RFYCGTAGTTVIRGRCFGERYGGKGGKAASRTDRVTPCLTSRGRWSPQNRVALAGGLFVEVHLLVRLQHDPAIATEAELHGLAAAAADERSRGDVRVDVRRQRTGPRHGRIRIREHR